MAGIFEIKKSKDDQFFFVLKASNGEVILTSEMYQQKASAEKGIASVRTNSPLDERYTKLVATDGRPYFTLKAANHEVIGNSQMYSSETTRDGGIASVKTNGATATLSDLT